MTADAVKRAICVLIGVATLCLMQGCSEGARRLTYESLQARQQLECQKTPGQVCPERAPYDGYQQQREE